MLLDLPQDLVSRLQQRVQASPGASEADVIRAALDSLDWREAERAAIAHGLEAMQAGRVRPFEEFDREFRARHGMGKA
jgi:predicted transcriptional regulator